MANRLNMRFTTEEEGKYFSLSVDNVKEDANGQPAVTQEQVLALMNLIIAKKIFVTKNGALVGKKDAKVVTTDSKEFEMK